MSYKYSESIEVWPFRRSSSCLENCLFRQSKDDEYKSDENIIVNSEDFAHDSLFEPQIKLGIDAEKLLEETGLTADKVMLALSLRDRALRRFILIEKRSLQDYALDEELSIPSNIITGLSGRRGFEFVLTINPIAGLENYSAGDRVSEKIFIIGKSGEIHGGFPMDAIYPHDEQWDKDYSPDTCWYISWAPKDVIFNNESLGEQVLKIIYNKNYSDKLAQFENEVGTPAEVERVECAIEQFLEIALVYLSHEDDVYPEPERNSDGFYPRFIRALLKLYDDSDIKRTFKDLKQQYRDEQSFQSKLRARLQRFYNLNKLAQSL